MGVFFDDRLEGWHKAIFMRKPNAFCRIYALNLTPNRVVDFIAEENNCNVVLNASSCSNHLLRILVLLFSEFLVLVV